MSGALNYFIPMEEGEFYWVAKIAVSGKAAYYCVSETLLSLLLQVLEKGQTHFLGLLDVKGVSLEISSENFAHSPVPGHIANKAYKNIPEKRVGETLIPAIVSIPVDVELEPISELGKRVKGFTITRREILAKYEISAIVNSKSEHEIEDFHIEEINGEVFWVASDNGKKLFNCMTGEHVSTYKRSAKHLPRAVMLPYSI